jgi:hypothetical protein
MSDKKIIPINQDEKACIWEDPIDLSSLAWTEPAPLKWFCKDRIQAGRGILLTGIGGSSKTRLLYHLAIGAITGKLSWLWEVEAIGRAVLVLTEDTPEDVHRTLHFITRGLKLSRSEIKTVYDCIIPYPLAGSDAKLLETKRGTIAKTELFYQFQNKIKSLSDIVFVGIDPALSVTEGDELDQGHQRALGKMIDDLAVNTGATCALVSHATKASLNKDELDSHNSRGGGAITDAVRGEYSMRNMTAKEAGKAGITDLEERKRHVQLVATKGNHLPPSAFVPVWFRRDNSGTLFEAEIVFGDTGPSSNDIKAYEILCELSSSFTTTLKSWRDECIKCGVVSKPDATDKTSQGKTKKQMDRIVAKLLQYCLIDKGAGRGIYIPVTDRDNEGTNKGQNRDERDKN